MIAGFQYAIEIATTTSEVPYAEYLDIVDAPQVAVTPATSYVGVGQQRQFAASVTASANTSPGVRWTIAPPQYGQITQTGKYTAPAAVSSATTITITASSFANSSAQGIASVTLLPTGQSDFSLSVTPSPQSVMQGNSIAYTVNTAGNPGPETVTFSVSGLPTNTTYSFDPASVVSGATSTLTILTTSGTSTGTFFPIVTGTGSGGIVVHNSTVSLTVNPPAPPELAIAKSHAGNFRQSQSHAVYTLTVSNNNTAGPTNGTVTVTENLPTGLSLASTSGMSGTGWSCSVNTCTRADSIGTGASYPPITVLVNVAANTASQVTNSVTVSGGGSPSSSATDMTNVTALASVPKYLVGDIYPSTSDVAGSFGSDGINTLDLLAVLRAATNVSGSVPDACSDRYDAMDAYPLDGGSTRGGDGSIDTLDLLAILQRVTNADVNRPSRAARTSCITASVAPQRKADKASGSIELGAATQSSDGWWHTPVYLRATADLDLMGLALSLGYGADALPAGAQTRFVASGRPPNITDQDLPGIVALAWLHGWQAKAGQRLLIGSFDSTIATAPTFFGASANATGDGHAIHLSMQQSQMLRQ